ncbi:hypothetical protein BJF78_32655 [Pseudonocardia sp. CNS-139]|nr:hypothetical protein BJF78_32655 [Pseudonocardia sp. CNS-139]
MVTVRPGDSLAVAVKRMTELRLSALPVVDDVYHLLGIVSLIDVLRHREEGGDDTTSVGAVMNPDVLSVPPHASLGLLAHRLRTYGELRVMPVAERKVLVGVVTRSDLLRSRTRPGPLGRLVARLRGGAADPLDDLIGSGGPAPAHSGARLVREVMTADVATAQLSDTLDDVADRLVERRFTALPVVDGQGRLVGIVSEADLLGREPLSGRVEGRTVASVMTQDVVTVGPEETVAAARLLVAERGLRVVPVVGDGGLLAGVLSRSDLV